MLAQFVLLLTLQQDASEGAAFFEKNVRPILVQHCLGCHSATSQPIMSGLRLDSRDFALKGGMRGASIAPGNPAESLLLKVVLHTAGPLKMPPGSKLKPADTALLAQWIQMGAPWGSSVEASTTNPAKHWAFIPPSMPTPPTNGAANPIDAFLLHDLQAKGLQQAKPADKRTLIRRATYDLTGLPPTPAEVSAFVDDTSPDAYAKLIDRLLASPRYGERWGRHWLDVARYADSNGLDENLVYKNAFRYRDYVIAAFNKDKPYDQFIHEQLAGDLLPPTNDLQTQFERWTATGFLSLGAKMLAEDDPVKMEMDIVDEQLDTTMRAFAGLTIGCARCHDHKFDPIPQADYYSMAGIFKSSKTMENFKVVAQWHEYVLAPKQQRDELAAHKAKVEAKRSEITMLADRENSRLANEARNRVGAYLMAAAEVQRNSAIQVAPVERESGAVAVRTHESYNRGNAPKKLEKKQANAPKDSQGPYFAEWDIEAPAGGDYQIDLYDEEKGSGTADLWINGEWVRQGNPPVSNREASPEAGGWSYLAIVRLRKGINVIRLEHASRFPYFEKLLVTRSTLDPAPLTTVQIARKYNLNPGFLEQITAYLSGSSGAAASPLYAWEMLGAARTEWSSPIAKLFTNETTAQQVAARYEEIFQQAEREGKDGKDPSLKAAYDFLHEKFGPFRTPGGFRRYYTEEIRARLKVLDAEVKALDAATPDLPQAMGVTESATIGDLPIHLRGSHWTLGEKVPRRFLRVISGDQQQPIGGQQSGRLQLAQWLTAKDHPLTSRVMVNRIWRWHFGRGIVPSVDNFGRLGERPTNQQLLDWLATRFVEEGWSIKAMHRLMMQSNAYRMSSDHNAKAMEVDPENILLWRFPRKRLEAEAVRDGIMTVSGGLKHDNPGGSILKYKSRQYVANTSKGGEIDYDTPIRSVYVPVVRSSLYDVFRAFDIPDPATSNGDRDSTVVAPQALFMLNSSVMLKHSRQMAERLLHDEPDDRARVRAAYETALSRPPSTQEIDRALTFVARMEKEWKGDRARAWQSFCKALLGSSEFIYVN